VVSRNLSTSTITQTKKWKYLLRPDLRGPNHPKEKLATLDLSNPEEKAAFKTWINSNHLYWWRKVDPDEICRRLRNVLATDFNKPNGYGDAFETYFEVVSPWPYYAYF
jgi:hypothetical protein